VTRLASGAAAGYEPDNQGSQERCKIFLLVRRRGPAAAARLLLRRLRGAAAMLLAWPLVRVRLAVPVQQLALVVAVAHLQAAVAQLAGGRTSAEVALPDDWEYLDGVLAAALMAC